MSVFDAILGQRKAEYRAEVVASYDPDVDPDAPMWGLLEDRIHPTSGRLLWSTPIRVRPREPSK